MAAIEPDSSSISAVVDFRKSVEELKSITNGISDIDEVLASTDTTFSQCDDTLKFIYNQNEKSEELQNTLQSMFSDMQSEANELETIDNSLKALAMAEKCMKLMKEIESHYVEKDFYRLVVKVEQLRLELTESPFRSSNVFKGILQKTDKWRTIASEWLGACLDQCITITSSQDSISCSVDRQYMKNLCKEASFDLLANVFNLFSGQLLSSIIVPILRRSVASLTTNADVLVVNLEKEELTDCADGFDCGNEALTAVVIPSIISVFKFVKEHVFVYVKTRKFYHDLIERFGSQVVNDMSSMLCSIFLRPLLPNRPSKLGSFQNLTLQVAELQTYLEETGFQTDSNKLLHEFVTSHVNTVLEKYETTLLVQARDIILLNWEDLEPANSADSAEKVKDQSALNQLPSRCLSEALNESLFGSSHQSLFALPPCKVSSSVVKFVGLIRQVTEEVRILATKYSNQANAEAWLPAVLACMAPLARHIADTFLVFLPMATASLKCNSLTAAAIILCDCAYFANSLLLLEMDFASIKTSLSSCQHALPSLIFLDMVQPARSHGWTSFHKALDQTRSQLLEIDLDAWCQGAGGKLMASGFRMRCEQSLTLVVSKLAQVTATLRQVLPTTLASAALGLLIDAVLSSMVSQLISRVDISDAESRVQFEMLTRFSDDMILKVGSIAASENVDTPQSPIMGKVYLSKLCPESWPRFLDMISLLDSDLATIVNRWADGAGPLATSFAADELRTIMRALFQNSEVRQRALNSIK